MIIKIDSFELIKERLIELILKNIKKIHEIEPTNYTNLTRVLKD